MAGSARVISPDSSFTLETMPLGLAPLRRCNRRPRVSKPVPAILRCVLRHFNAFESASWTGAVRIVLLLTDTTKHLPLCSLPAVEQCLFAQPRLILGADGCLVPMPPLRSQSQHHYRLARHIQQPDVQIARLSARHVCVRMTHCSSQAHHESRPQSFSSQLC